MNNLSIFLMLVGLSLSGCATSLSPRASKIQDADQHLVAGCKFVGSVTGTSGMGNIAAATGINNAKNEAREQAVRLNATHIVWFSVAGGYTPTVSGNAYKCNS